jgi:polysaccharide export outer membrane protein
VRISVWRHPELSGDFTVGRDSSLVHPLYQSVKVGGVPLSVARERIRSFLVSYEQGVLLSVEPLVPVTVVGEVRAPNLYRFPSGTTVAQAVALAGGPTERGQLRHVRVIGLQGDLVLDLLADNARAEPFAIASRDQVIVGRRRDFNLVRDLLVPLASVTGAVAAIISVSRQR